MAKVFDLRSTGGQVIFLGEALALPQSAATLPPSNISYMAGSLRFNPQTNAVEFLSSDRVWRDITNSNIERVVTVTDVDYTLSQEGTYYRVSALSDAVVRVPNSTALNFPLGTTLRFIRTTTNAVEFTPASGVTINSRGTRTIGQRWGTVSLIKVSLNEWDLAGDVG